jgi:hypothetical protein
MVICVSAGVTKVAHWHSAEYVGSLTQDYWKSALIFVFSKLFVNTETPSFLHDIIKA